MIKLEKEHLDWIDNLKGFAIITVVVGHAIAWNFHDFGYLIENGDRKDLFWWHLIYSFHMPLFFWVSGFLLPRNNLDMNTLRVVIWRRFYTLIVPYFFSGSVLYWLSMGKAELWFLKCLFEILVIALLYEYLRNRYNLGLKFDVAFWCVSYFILKFVFDITEGSKLNDIFSLDLILGGNYVGFVFGIFCRRYKNLWKFTDSNFIYTVCLVIFSVLFAIHLVTDTYIVSKMYRYIIPICAIVCIVFIFKNKIFDNIQCTKLFAYLGKHSLEIYILQDFFCFRLLDIGEYQLKLVHSTYYMDIFWGHTCMLLLSLSISMIMIVLCLITMNVIRASDLLSMLFLGRKNK